MSTYQTYLKVWSCIGNTPLTKRGSYYRDLLIEVTMQCATPAEAQTAVEQLIATTPHGASGHFYMPDHPNQNIRDRFVTV